jgi:hypothetical protein
MYAYMCVCIMYYITDIWSIKMKSGHMWIRFQQAPCVPIRQIKSNRIQSIAPTCRVSNLTFLVNTLIDRRNLLNKMPSYLPKTNGTLIISILAHPPSCATFQIPKFKTQIPQILYGMTCRGRYGLGNLCTSIIQRTQEKGWDRDPHVRAHGQIPRGQRWKRRGSTWQQLRAHARRRLTAHH